jgi:transposase
MGKSLSLDIRERVVSLVEEGFSCHETGRRLRISAAGAVRIMQRKRRSGSLASETQGRPCISKLDAVSGFPKAGIEATPDMTMPELAAALFNEYGVRASPAMLSRHLIHRLGYTYKKIADCDRTPRHKSARRAFRVAASSSAEDVS